MHTLLKTLIFIFSISLSTGSFAAVKISTSTGTLPTNTESTGSKSTAYTGTLIITGAINSSSADQIISEEKQEKEKTINDINTFLIESYKIKIDKILANLNISIERITNNDPIAQAKLLEKIRADINIKIQIINSRTISENRKKILSSVFLYIQENLDAKISKLVGQK